MQPLPFRPGQRIITIDAENPEDVDTSLLGTDFMFYLAFFGKFQSLNKLEKTILFCVFLVQYVNDSNQLLIFY